MGAPSTGAGCRAKAGHDHLHLHRELAPADDESLSPQLRTARATLLTRHRSQVLDPLSRLTRERPELLPDLLPKYLVLAGTRW